MISKLAKAHESWVFKSISAAVAVSFVSLFGVTGYINSASQNQTVIRVGDKKITQSELAFRQQKELTALKNLLGEELDISDELRSSVTAGVVKQLIDESVLEQAVKKYDIHFPRAYVQQVVFSQPEFKNPNSGMFDPNLFRQALSIAGISEGEYVAMVERTMASKMLVSDLMRGFGVPNVLSKAIHKMDNQRKTFKYVTISPSDINIERNISDDEIKQYFEDFSERFMLPETRNVEVVFIPNDVVLNKYAASENMVKDYFEENKKEFDQPEKREVLQMVFTDKTQAEKALADVKSGKDFAAVAVELNAENSADATLGIVAEDELAEGLSYDVFNAEPNTPLLLEVADTWQVVSVKNVIPAKKADFSEVKEQIYEILKNENLYDAMREVKAEIDDAVNAGQGLAEIAKKYGVETVVVNDIREDVLATTPDNIKQIAKTLDFNELAFSYGLNEITSAEEFDDGVVVLQVNAIIDAHMPEINDVKDNIVALWTVQEKSALAKETAENFYADVEDGGDFVQAAKARNLEVYRSEPLKRNESFANLSVTDMNDLFLSTDNESKLFELSGNAFVVAVPFETVNFTDELTEDALKEVKLRAEASLSKDLNQSVLNSYAEDFKIKIDYSKAGFSE